MTDPLPYPGTDRETFMGRVREALERTETPTLPELPELNDRLVRGVSTDAERLDRFVNKVHEVGMEPAMSSPDSFVNDLANVLRKEDIRRLTLGASEETASLITEAATIAQADLVEPDQPSSLSSHFEVEAGITDVHAAIAETGSLLVSSGSAHSRGTWLIPPLHIAIVREHQIVADLVDVWATMMPLKESSTESGNHLPASAVLITGPSKTADIEGILITGVHGPRRVIVFIIQD